MAKVRILGSGSTGNSYIIETSGEKLLFELGINWNEILKGLGFNLKDVVGSIVSHVHIDHSKSILKSLTYQIPVYSCKDVAEKFKGVKALQPNHKYRIGGFVVQPIPVQHNVENYSYLIEHKEIGRMLFATDLISFPYSIKNLNHIFIEANYSEELLIEKLCNGLESRSHSEYHMEIENTIEALKRLNNKNLSSVTLIHLSNFGSSERGFEKKVLEEVGIKAKCARKGMEVALDKEDF